MFVKDIKFDDLKAFIESLPEYMQITSIDFKNGYSAVLKAGTNEIKKRSYDENLNELNFLLTRIRANDIANADEFVGDKKTLKGRVKK